jgi:HKD family nuclease
MSKKIISIIESEDIIFKYCRICGEFIDDKQHEHKRPEDKEEYAVLYFESKPGDIAQDLYREKEKAIKRKFKTLKQQILLKSATHESAS